MTGVSAHSSLSSLETITQEDKQTLSGLHSSPQLCAKVQPQSVSDELEEEKEEEDRCSVKLLFGKSGSSPAPTRATAARPLSSCLFVCFFFNHQGKPLIITGRGQLHNVSIPRWRELTWARGVASGWSCFEAGRRWDFLLLLYLFSQHHRFGCPIVPPQ